MRMQSGKKQCKGLSIFNKLQKGKREVYGWTNTQIERDLKDISPNMMVNFMCQHG